MYNHQNKTAMSSYGRILPYRGWKNGNNGAVLTEPGKETVKIYETEAGKETFRMYGTSAGEKGL
jgi:hypothetical protein